MREIGGREGSGTDDIANKNNQNGRIRRRRGKDFMLPCSREDGDGDGETNGASGDDGQLRALASDEVQHHCRHDEETGGGDCEQYSRKESLPVGVEVMQIWVRGLLSLDLQCVCQKRDRCLRDLGVRGGCLGTYVCLQELYP